VLGSEWWARISRTRDSGSWRGWWYLGVVCLALLLLCAVTTKSEAMGGGACTPMDVCVLTVARRGVSQRVAFFILLAGASSTAQRQSLRPLMMGLACATGMVLLPSLLALVLAPCTVGLSP
jgi:hypothetical protein